MVEIKRPNRLALTDLPRDVGNAFGNLRPNLVSAFNYCRAYPRKMTVLKAILKYTYNRIIAWEKEQAAQLVAQEKAREEDAETKAKNAIEVEAKELGFDLDMRKTSENLQKELDDAKEQRVKDAAGGGESSESAKDTQPSPTESNAAPVANPAASAPNTTDNKADKKDTK